MLGTAGAVSYSMSTSNALRNETAGHLVPKQWVPLKLKSSKDVSHDTKEIVFDLDNDKILGGSTAYCVLFKFMQDGKPVVRPYTPVSDPSTVGEAVFVIKKYPGGAMGTHVHDLKPGETIDVQGPIPKYPFEKPNKHKKIVMLGGGSGITPLYQVLAHIAKDPQDKTEVHLLYGSQTPNDILLKKEIDNVVAKKPGQLKVTYYVDKGDKSFDGKIGYISKEDVAAIVKPDDENHRVFVCGPPGFMKALSGPKKSPTDQGDLTGSLQELGFTKDTVFKF